ncbi:MAG: hypothetical protein QG608_3556 [Actinomycetota bacterium]|nr:hypothetical protein [Actinomycetota bacterium]
MTSSTVDPVTEVERLAASTEPFVIGVRHHSPAVSGVLPALLDGFGPEVIGLELPTQFQRWLPWLTDPATSAPVALAGAGEPLWFYPFADFSPELVAARWARAHGVELVAFDLPLGDPGWAADRDGGGGRKLATALRTGATGRDGDDLWDRVVEAPAPGSPPERVRRAALAVGWALRADDGEHVDAVDLRREAYMRSALAEHGGRRCAVVVGAYHAAALLDGATGPCEDVADAVTSLVPYADPLLDSRSGYPAGIRDPRWQAAVLSARGDPERIETALVGFVVEICGRIRAQGHPAGPGEAREVVRLAGDLARLRGLPAPARGELVEALTTVLAQGEPLGRGRIVAHAMEQVLVGDRRGRLPAGAPRCGLAPAVEGLLRRLHLPDPDAPARTELRLDPLRSLLDARREVTLHRLRVCGVPYAQPGEVAGVGNAEAVTTRWVAQWTPAVAALLEVAGLRGVTLAQASAGVLRQARAQEREQGGSTGRQVLDGLQDATRCGLPDLVAERLTDVAEVLPRSATLAELIEGLDLLARLTTGGLPGQAPSPEIGPLAEVLHEAAIRQIDGLAGSVDVADARTLLALVVRRDRHGLSLRLDAALAHLSDHGTALMRAAAGAVRVVLGLDDATGLGQRAAAWLDLDSPEELTGRLSGLLAVAGPLLEAGADVLDPLLLRVERLPDAVFLHRLAALRGGFDVLSPAARDRLLTAVEDRLSDRLDLVLDIDPVLLGQWAQADAHALSVLERQGLAGAVALEPPDRWRLVLGRRRDLLPPTARRMALALDELYGNGRGEGSKSGLGGGADGAEPPSPSVREWSEELTTLFGPLVREEVLAAAAATGRVDAALALDPASARPSVTLLTSVLSLAGALPEHVVARLRPLVAKVVADLTRRLATQLAPALSGLATARPTRRPSGRLDLRRTINANLRMVLKRPDGTVLVVPERPVFATRAHRSTDWRLVLVVDVSGSMEASTVWAAITAAVLSGVPALTTNLLAFSTEVMDLSGTVSDPLSLLLEVSVGGGTSIATGLSAARSLVTVPTRTMVVVVSDFEEGGPVGPLLAEVRSLVEAGVHVLGCASLDQAGAARYSVATAQQLVAAGMPIAALSPLELARWVAEQIT